MSLTIGLGVVYLHVKNHIYTVMICTLSHGFCLIITFFLLFFRSRKDLKRRVAISHPEIARKRAFQKQIIMQLKRSQVTPSSQLPKNNSVIINDNATPSSISTTSSLPLSSLPTPPTFLSINNSQEEETTYNHTNNDDNNNITYHFENTNNILQNTNNETEITTITEITETTESETNEIIGTESNKNCSPYSF